MCPCVHPLRAPSGCLAGVGGCEGRDTRPLGHCVRDMDAPGRRCSIWGVQRASGAVGTLGRLSRRVPRACMVSPPEEALTSPEVQACSLPQKKVAHAGLFRALRISSPTRFRSLESKPSMPSRLS